MKIDAQFYKWDGGLEGKDASKTPGQVIDIHTFPILKQCRSSVNIRESYFQTKESPKGAFLQEEIIIRDFKPSQSRECTSNPY